MSLMRFFCFKQKTAYEMRISDWSSDVCSSDLAADARRTQRALHRAAPSMRTTRAARRSKSSRSASTSSWKAASSSRPTTSRDSSTTYSARQSVGKGTSGYVSVDPGGCLLLKKKKNQPTQYVITNLQRILH